MVEHCRIVIMVLRSAICRRQYTLRDIRPKCAHAELFRYSWWCWGRCARGRQRAEGRYLNYARSGAPVHMELLLSGSA